MIDGRKSKRGTAVEDRIAGAVDRARHEFETISDIVASGMLGYGFEGDDLVEFVRRSIHALVDAGAKPFVARSIGWPPGFHPTDEWGATREDIAETIIADWRRQGGGELEWGAYPFAFVEDYYPDGWPAPTA